MADRKPLPGITERFQDWDAEGVTISAPAQCDACIHRVTGTDTCAAVPIGIPIDILTGDHDHRRRYPGDGGIRFAAVEIEAHTRETPGRSL